MKGFMYILLCADNTYYTGSTKNLDFRIKQHNAGEGANYTKKRRPIKLIYYEEFQNISDAFNREKQIQNWSHKKKAALIKNNFIELQLLATCNNDTTCLNKDTPRLRSETN